jgi:hypothetical protein
MGGPFGFNHPEFSSPSFRRKPESSFNTLCEALKTGFVSFGRVFWTGFRLSLE